MEFKFIIYRCASLLFLSYFFDTALCQADDVRLVGGETENEGRVEIKYKDEWGTICDYSFTTHDAYVICHQLGYFDVVDIYRTAHFGEGSGPILWALMCSGRDYQVRWTDCLFFVDWNTTACVHSEDVGVKCNNISAKVTDVRLADGETEHEGRVEIFYRDEWGTMCDSSVTLHEGHIICRELGYLGAVEIYRHGTSTGPVDGPIAWNFNCEGIESELQWTDCYIREWNTSECSHVEDAGLRCNNMPYPEYDVRLVDGKSEYEGRVEVFYYGQWGTVCGRDFDTRNGDVICRQLGFPRAAQIFDPIYFGVGKGPILKQLSCNGDEVGLGWRNCTFDGWDTAYCSHSSDVGLSCVNSSSLSWNNVRLINVGLTEDARLEIYYDNKWGSVCDNDFTIDEANVICRQLGYVRASDYYNESFFGEGYGPIMEIIDCVGDESNWTNCEFSGWGTTACTHSEDIGLQCTNYADLSEISDFPVVFVAIIAVGLFVLIVIMVFWALCSYWKKRTSTNRRRQEVLSAAANKKHELAAAQPMVPTQSQGEGHPPSDKDAMV